MARAPIPSIQEAPTKSQPILENYVKVLGVVPNFFSLISQSPDALKAIADMHATLGKSIGHKTRERLHIMTAEVNGCSYCLTAHSYLAGKLGGRRQTGRQADPLGLRVARNTRGFQEDGKVSRRDRVGQGTVRGKHGYDDLGHGEPPGQAQRVVRFGEGFHQAAPRQSLVG